MCSKKENSGSPHAVVGAGKLVATVWRDELKTGIVYRFNSYRIDPSSGEATQLFGPEDLPDLVRLCHALTCAFFDDQEVSSSVRDRLSLLLEALELAAGEGEL